MKQVQLFLDEADVDYLKKEGFKVASKIRKIVSDYVLYHKAKEGNPLKELVEDKE
jgi:hypothetical protein